MTKLIIGIIGGIISVILGIWQISSRIQKKRATHEQIRVHLETGDRFMEQREFDQAIKEYEKALELAPANIDAHRKIIAVKRENLLSIAFLRDKYTDFALRDDFKRVCYVDDAAVNDALTQIYQLQARHPELKNDIDLLLDEAYILKTDGDRIPTSIKVLTKARALDPNNALVLAELGLLSAVSAKTIEDKQAGIALIRQALQLQPEEARYHFYLARCLENICVEVKEIAVETGVDTASAYAESIREFHQAIDLIDNTDIWSRSIRSIATYRSIEIFHFFARTDEGLLTSQLNLSYEERIKEIEFLLNQGIPGSRSGLKDYPLYWLAELYFATGQQQKAEESVLELTKGANLDNPTNPWAQLYARIMQSGGQKVTTENTQLQSNEKLTEKEPG